MRPTMPARCDTVVSSSSRRVACPAHTAKLHRCSSITDEFSTGVMDAHRENLVKSSLFERPPRHVIHRRSGGLWISSALREDRRNARRTQLSGLE